VQHVAELMVIGHTADEIIAAAKAGRAKAPKAFFKQAIALGLE
jgi:hypothetical protein